MGRGAGGNAGHFGPYSLSQQFSVAELKGQFLLSRGSQPLPWTTDCLHGWCLAVEESLPVFRCSNGAEYIGWILGEAIGPSGEIIEENVTLGPDDVEKSIYELGGRFLVILPGLKRVYMDPCGLLSAVFSEADQMVASSSSLIPHSDKTRDRTEFIRAIGIPYVNAMYPVGMTPRFGVERLIPNHYLDLDSWTTKRHWPSDPITPVTEESLAVAEIAEITKRQIAAITRSDFATLRLTAGKDSRMLLACARDAIQRLECVTADLNDPGSRNDCRVAAKLSKIAGVPHRVMSWVEPQSRDLNLWLFRTGLEAGEVRGWQGCTTYRTQLDASRRTFYGSIGEVARSWLWMEGDRHDTEISAERLLARCICPKNSETEGRINRWIESTVVSDSFQLLDLFYVEQRVGCWAGVWANAESAYSKSQAFPMSHRRIIELMIGLPVETRRTGSLPEKIISLEWPELLRIPFNLQPFSYRLAQGVREQFGRGARAARNPAWAISKIRQRIKGSVG